LNFSGKPEKPANFCWLFKKTEKPGKLGNGILPETPIGSSFGNRQTPLGPFCPACYDCRFPSPSMAGRIWVMGWARMANIGMVFFLFFWLTGCSGNPPPLTPVTGKVTYRGFPVPGGPILFIPDSSKGQRGAIVQGTINPDGSYTIKSGKEGGIPAGWYKVTVASLIDANGFSGQNFGPSLSQLPEKYRDPELSQLICEVKPRQSNQINFQLE
jgi:hypothetical protein